MISEFNHDTRATLIRTKTFLREPIGGFNQVQPREGLSRRTLVLQLDAHGAGTGRVFDRELIDIIGGTVVEAANGFHHGEPADGSLTILQDGDLCEDGWFGNAFVIGFREKRGQIGRRDRCGQGAGWNANSEDEKDGARENHGRLVVSGQSGSS